MKLTELKQTKGTYAGVHFDDDTNDAIIKYIKINKIPNGLAKHKLHSTVLYSKKHCPDYKAPGKLDPVLIGTPTDFDVWESNPDNGPKMKCLVLKYDCPELIARHKQLMKGHDATYDYDKYEPHVTLSYDIGDFDIDKLSKVEDVISKIVIDDEYHEDLDLDWAVNHGS